MVAGRLSNLPRVLHSGVARARTDLAEHVAPIRSIPHRKAGLRNYVADESWNLAGGFGRRSPGTVMNCRFWLRGLDLNQRPLGYEPNELPDCSTPHLDYIETAAAGQINPATPPAARPVLR